MGCEPDYAYLLGLYLGDGHISEMNKGTFRLRITLDSRYPRIIDGAAGAIDGLLPAQRVGKYPHPTANLVTVASYSWRWLYLLPQHGPGLKHSRETRLHDWQRPIVDAHPRSFVRGLLHSDGCRFHAHQTTRGRTYSYARYAFVNTSSDILSLFCEYLDVLGIAWTRATRHTIQIARREAVARLDEFVGPKQ